MNFLVEKISGASGDRYTCGVFSKHVTLEGGESGVLVSCVLVEIASLKNIDNASGFLHDGFESDARKISESREGILPTLKVAGESQAHRLEGVGAEASFVLAFFYKEAVYVVRHGERIRVNIFRPPSSYEIKFDWGSGRVRRGDLVLVSSDKFVETFDSDIFAKSVIDDFGEVMDGLATDISALSGKSEIGAIFVRVAGEGAEEEKTISPEEEKDDQEDAVVGEKEDVGVLGPGAVSPTGSRTPLPVGVFSSLGRELGRLRVGDIGALFRLRRNIIFLAVLVVLVLAASGFMTIQKGKNSEKTETFRNHLQLAGDKYNEALGVLDLNRDKARSLLVDAEGEVKLAVALFPKDDGALRLLGQIQGKLAETASLSGLDFEVFFESGSSAAALSRGSGNFFLFGDDGVVELGGEGKKVRDIADVRADGGFVYDKTVFTVSGGKVFKLMVDGTGEEVAEAVGVRDMAVFLGNIYILGADQILKFVPIADGYAQSANYLEEPETFGDGSRFAVDGSIWVTNGKEVLKYTRGARDVFNIEGINGIGELGEIYTNSDSDKIYVVDRSNSALIVIGKDGVYAKSYNSAEFGRASDLYVDEGTGKIYVVVGSKVLVANL